VLEHVGTTRCKADRGHLVKIPLHEADAAQLQQLQDHMMPKDHGVHRLLLRALQEHHLHMAAGQAMLAMTHDLKLHCFQCLCMWYAVSLTKQLTKTNFEQV
jgi:hypothetical protein